MHLSSFMIAIEIPYVPLPFCYFLDSPFTCKVVFKMWYFLPTYSAQQLPTSGVHPTAVP